MVKRSLGNRELRKDHLISSSRMGSGGTRDGFQAAVTLKPRLDKGVGSKGS